MNKSAFFLIVMIIISMKLFASDYEIINKNNGFILKANQIDYVLKDKQFAIDKFSGNKFNSELDSNLQILSFIFAYPNDFTYTIKSEYAAPMDYMGLFIPNTPQLVNIYKSDKMRNVPSGFMQIFPYKFSAIEGTIQLLKSIEIEVTFNRNLSVKPLKNLSTREFAFFDSYINSKQIEFMPINEYKSDISLLANDNWYNPSKNYIKIDTKSDGVASVKLIDIFNIMPEWKGKNSNALTLINNGIQIPIYIKNDNGILAEDGELFFFGSRAFGDSTYYENYTDKKAYFLTIDETSNNSRLSLKDEPVGQTATINKVKTKYHIEKDSAYFAGHVLWGYQLMSETMPGEGWYWKIIYPNLKIGEFYVKDDIFHNDIVITPSSDLNDELKISFGFYAFEDTAGWKGERPYPPAYYDLNMNLNNNYVARDYCSSSYLGRN